MKQLLIVAGIAFITISSFSSCKKTFHCSCTTTTMVNDTVTAVTTNKAEYRVTKNDAKNRCADRSQSSMANGNTTIVNTDCSFE